MFGHLPPALPAIALTASSAFAHEDVYDHYHEQIPEEYINESGEYTHDGLLLRARIGMAYNHTEYSGGLSSSDWDDLKIYGAGLRYQADIGFALTPQMVLFGTIGATRLENPHYKWFETSGELENSTLTIGHYGVGFDWYFLPSNAYIGASLHFVQNRLDIEFPDGLDISDTSGGIGYEGRLGKEWWVSPDVALGLGGYLGFSELARPYSDAANIEIGATLNLTYN